MATDKSQARSQALGIIDPRLRDPSTALWPAESSYTQAGPLPGDPEPQQATDLVLKSSGTQSASKALRIRSMVAGMPDAAERSGRFGWRYSGDTNWRGWNPPQTVQNWEAISYDNTTRDPHPHAVSLANGKMVIVYEDQDGSDYRIKTATRGTDGTWAAPVSVETTTTAPINGQYPCIVQMPDLSLHLWFWDHGPATVGATPLNVKMYRSTDDGVTWTLASAQCLTFNDVVSYFVLKATGAGALMARPGRIRAVYHEGNVCIVLNPVDNNTGATSRSVFFQFCSVDGGASWQYVDSTADSDTADTGGFHDLVVHGGKVWMSWCRHSDQDLRIRKSSSAFISLFNDTSIEVINGNAATVSGASMTAGESALVSLPEGELLVFFRDLSGGSGPVVLALTRDEWSTKRRSASPVYESSTAGTAMYDISAVRLEGRIALTHSIISNGYVDDSVAVAYLGGYTTVEYPQWEDVSTLGTGLAYRQIQFTTSYLPLDVPGSSGWTATGAGADALSAGALSVTGNTTMRNFERNPGGTVAAGYLVKFQVQVNAGGLISQDHCSVRLRLADGTNDYDISIRLSSGSIRIHDNNAAATVGSDLSISTTAGVQVLVAMDSSGVYLWGRVASAGSDADWSAGPSGSLTNDMSTPDANNSIKWGCLFAYIGAYDQDWTEVQYAVGASTGTNLVTAPTNPDDLLGRPFSSSPVYVDDGVKVTAVDGPAMAAEIWNLDTRYTHRIENLFPTVEPSPRVTWRSTSLAAQTIALALDPDLLGTAESDLGGDIIGIALLGINFLDARFERYDVGASGWVELDAIDASTGMSGLAFTRVGDSVVPNGANALWLHENEARDWTFQLDGSTFRPVRFQRAGKWNNSYAGPQVKAHLSGVVGGDAASGTGSFWARDVFCFVNLLGETAAGLRLRIPTQTTVVGGVSYFEIGQMVPVIVKPFGLDTSWGRTVKRTANVDLTTARDWTTRSRKWSPTQREVRFGWQDGIDTTQVFESPPSPDYISGSTSAGAEALSALAETPYQVDGLYDLLDGEHQHVVYIPRLEQSADPSTDARVLTGRERFVYGRMIGPVRSEAVLGDEASSEVVRVSQLTIREEI
ncbi:MAG TPA: sialidase family protein [Myxococcota bacterium]|nr:sialidase family protein [Myxococcota bacterium]